MDLAQKLLGTVLDGGKGGKSTAGKSRSCWLLTSQAKHFVVHPQICLKMLHLCLLQRLQNEHLKLFGLIRVDLLFNPF